MASAKLLKRSHCILFWLPISSPKQPQSSNLTIVHTTSGASRTDGSEVPKSILYQL